ncbi:type II toxin-antitoxin system HipA family toxin [Candidatus Palauibacter sp.]|uniref:type II toxin-antitoxin system HipA family toxin n=1 Tax=Candidatus Palauibacter sp. TaxID=3101350 RepID=UPI003B023981
MTDANVNLWGRRIGAVSWDAGRGVGVFQYDPAFVSAGIEVSPIAMPVRETPYAFPAPALGETFKGLPGLLADALPDSFGNRLIDVWLAETERRLEDFSPVDRLCYIGKRGVGALEFEPAVRSGNRGGEVEIARLVDLTNRVLDERGRLSGRLDGGDDGAALEDILSVGTSAGGARAKAVLAWNPETGEFRSGQVDAEAGFEDWILKFDGVTDNGDRELADPLGYGRIEYAYHLMAREAGIEMSECRLHHEGGRSHFMTRRFDRDAKGRKIHMQSLAALRHFDYHMPGAYAYEQAIETIRRLRLGMAVIGEQYRRAVFNIVARNQDDHVKNIAFLMNRSGKWRLSPAYDVAYAYNPQGLWTGRHQMSMVGKRNGFERADLLRFAETSGLKIPVASRVIDRVLAAVGSWPRFASEAGVEEPRARRVGKTHRLVLR